MTSLSSAIRKATFKFIDKDIIRCTRSYRNDNRDLCDLITLGSLAKHLHEFRLLDKSVLPKPWKDTHGVRVCYSTARFLAKLESIELASYSTGHKKCANKSSRIAVQKCSGEWEEPKLTAEQRAHFDGSK